MLLINQLCLLWSVLDEVFMSPINLKELKNLFTEMIDRTEKMINTLESEQLNTRLCVSGHVTLNNGMKNSPAAFHLYLSKLDKLHKFSLQKPFFFLQPRVKVLVSRDIDLGMRIGEKMKRYIIQPTNMDGLIQEKKFFKVACSSSKTPQEQRSSSLQHAYLKLYQSLKKISKSLLIGRFLDTK